MGDPAIDRGEYAVTWVERLTSHTKGKLAGQPFELLPWQRQMVGSLFGTMREDDTRRFRTCYLEVPRKNGKSTLGAALALYLLMADDELGAEIYSAAADRDQARIIYGIAKAMVESSPILSQECEVYNSAIVVPSTGSSYKAISADAATKHGYNAHGILFDELHAQRDRELWDVLTTSTGARSQPLTIAMTTAGWDRTSICWEIHQYAEAVRDGAIDDPTFLPVLYGADEGSDWTSEAVWRKANPSLGVSVPVSFLEAECAKAKVQPRFENTFRRLYLNQWTQQDARWLQMHAWGECSTAADLVPDEMVYAGLDLSSSTDYTAFVLAAPPVAPGKPWRVVPQFWIPGDKLAERAREERVPIDIWRDQGHLHVCPGEVIDYEQVFRAIEEATRRYRVAHIGYDRRFAGPLLSLLEPRLPPGTMVQVQQSASGLGASCQMLEGLVRSGELAHGGHPVLSWMAGNVAVKEDQTGAIYPVKARSSDRIDGIVALLMALTCWIQTRGSGQSSYNDPEKELIFL